MLVLKAQMCFETQRFFYGLEKKKKNYFPESTINHTGQELWSKNSMNFERMAGCSIHLICLRLYGSQEEVIPPTVPSSLCLFLFMPCYHKLKDKEMLMTPDQRIAQPYSPLLPRERCTKDWFLEKSYKLLPFR